MDENLDEKGPPDDTRPSPKTEKAESKLPDDVLHFVDPARDTVSSLAIRYGVPAASLRRANALFSDHLLVARRTIVIPGEWYDGVSLSPRPPGGEEEEARRGKIRRMMVACKVAEYDVAVVYLEQSGYDLDAAVKAWMEDEAWEKANPMRGRGP